MVRRKKFKKCVLKEMKFGLTKKEAVKKCKKNNPTKKKI